jgi:hypothetical protein
VEKSIRKMNARSAISSCISLLQENPGDLCYLLSIICIEDVYPMDSFSILIWFMMVDDNYKMRNIDKYIILQIVNNMCGLNKYYEYEIMSEHIEWTSHLLEHKKNSDILLSIYYLMEYEQDKKCKAMLNHAISHYYDVGEDEFPKTNWELPLKIYHKTVILREAVDCECFPNMVPYIKSKCNYGIPDHEIRKTIWNVDSGVNLRKKYTVVLSNNTKKSNVWELIKYYVDEFRYQTCKYSVLHS